MKIRMIRPYKSAPDGINVQEFETGRKYDVPERLARGFIDQGVACEDKDMGGAPETKAVDYEFPWGNEAKATPPSPPPEPVRKKGLKKRRR